MPGFNLILRALECVSVQSNSLPVCLFPECFCEVKYATFFMEETRQLLLHLWRADNESRKEATITACEGSLTALFWLLRLAIRIKFGLQKLAATHVRGH
jgi:hypothetical protein